MTNFLDDVFAALDDNVFEETPVDARTFVESDRYLNQPMLSDIQYTIVECMSQIYYENDCLKIMGTESGLAHFRKYTKNELILALGKGTNIGSTMAWSPEYGWKRIDEKLEDFGLIQSAGSVNGATAFYSEGIDHVFKVTTEFGYTFTGNAGHKMYGWKNTAHGKGYSSRGTAKEISIAELSKGDIALIYGDWEEPESPYEVSNSEARLIGYMIGDGTWVRNGKKGKRNPCFTNSTPEVQKDIVEIVESLGGSVKHYLSGAGCWAIRINGITEWFVKHGLIHDYHEKKPWNPLWMNMKREALASLINGLWATDGWGTTQDQVFRGAQRTGVSVAIELNSESIISGLHMALLRLGVKASMRKNREGTDKYSPMWRISITNRHFVKKFIDVVGFPVGKEQVFSKLYSLSNEKTYKNLEADQGCFRDRIKSIEYAGEQEVFACTVETAHNYLGNGFIHGNSGKDHVSTIAVAYIVYKLLCLNDPARYYGKPSGDAIDIMNVAINAQQAKNVFFKGFRNKIEKSPWFRGKFDAKMDSIEFDKAITVYSGHSERESHEGLNLFCAVLDEISGFALESTSGNTQAKTGDAIYKAFRGTVDSRFPDLGKVILLSFPRFKDDYISQKYNAAIADKETTERTYTFKINEELPDGIDGNEFDIAWEEDHIISYALPKVFALKRPTWEVNPTRRIEDFKNAFYTDPQDALQRFACCDENSLISTENGIVPLKNISIGNKVQSQYGPTMVTHKWEQDKKSIEIILDNGQKLACTKDHGLLQVTSIRNGKGVAERSGKYRQRWVEAGSLSVGDKIRTSYNSSISGGAQISYEEAYATGLILTDGWLRNDDRKYVGIACGTSQSYAENVSLTLNSIDDVSSSVQSRMPDPRLSNRKQHSVHIYQYDAVEKFERLGLTRSKAQDKLLPAIVREMNSGQFYAFMSGFIDGDGSFGRDGEIILVSTSKTMLEELQVVLAHHGLRSHLWLNRRASGGTINSTHDLWGLRLNRLASILLGENLNLLSDKATKNVQTPFVQSGKGVFEKEYGTIVKINDVGVRRVIDITTENHEFVANGIVVHNCMAPDAIDGYFKDHDKVRNAFSKPPAIVEGSSFQPWFKPIEGKSYYMHVDLAQKHDRCAVAMAHVDHWTQTSYVMGNDYFAPVVVVDFVYWWTPSKDKSVDFTEVRNFITGIKQSGFNLRAVTFDRWQSWDMMNELQALGINTERLSVAKQHYDDFKMSLMEDRVDGPDIELLIKELIQLRIIRDKIDHPRSGGKDLSDATCGAIYNAMTRTPRQDSSTVVIRDLKDITRGEQERIQNENVISAPPPPMPSDIKDFLSSIRSI